MCDLYAPIRAGSDIAFLGGLISYVIDDERWNTDSFFHEYLLHYTNAATIVRDDFQDTEDLDGVFSGLMKYEGGDPEWPYDGFVGAYDRDTWQYARQGGSPDSPAAARSSAPRNGPTHRESPGPANRFNRSFAGCGRIPPLRDETLQDPRCVFQVVRRHFAATRRRWSSGSPAARRTCS